MSRAKRRALAPRPPSAAVVAYGVTIRRYLSTITDAIKAAVYPALEDYSTAHPTPALQRLDAVSGNMGRRIDKLKVELQARVNDAEILPLVDAAARTIARYNAREIKRVLGIDPREKVPNLDQFRRANVERIKSIAADVLPRVEKVLEQNFGLRVEDLSVKIQTEFDVSESRGDLIARDQTLKLNAQLTRARYADVGIEKYVWTTSGDERVREEHEELDGQEFAFIDPPSVGNPGDDFQCRCTPYPVIPELAAAPDDEG